MMLRTFALALLAVPLLISTSAQAWWGGPGQGHNSYYGAGPVNADTGGSFNFNASFSGRGAGNGYNGYGPHPYLRPAPQSQSWIIRGVNFKYDSAELTPESMKILDSVAEVVRSRPVQPLEVGGHASAEGDDPYNMKLSNLRAQTVRAYLVKRGISGDLLTYRGYGETRPLVENMTEPGRRVNRRVELTAALHAQR
ncbi:MAG TPA: OmpA family protein [Gammaproteobacteria bacterium]|jgi:OOP family OmpA-OmpF porin|nr:OmpA family protein [Gammaproteobacteria bacterium]